MMVSADEGEVVNVGRATVANPANVVGLASGRVGTTTDAATVSGDEGMPLGVGGESNPCPQPQGFAVLAEHEPAEIGNAGQAYDLGVGQGTHSGDVP